MSRVHAARGIAVAAAMASALAAGCRRDGCVGGNDGSCVPSSACPALRFACVDMSGSVRAGVLGRDVGFSRMPGPKAQAAADDILLENDLVSVVLDAPGHAQNLAPSGGSILDFAPVGAVA